MTAQEFSSEFDLLYNNISSAQAPGLTEYEKSVFLTKAQDEIIKNYFTNVQGGNKYQQGIEDSNKRYADFSALLTVAVLNAETTNVVPFDDRGKIFKLPDGKTDKKVMIVITEIFKTGKSISENENPSLTSYQVIPLKFDEYIRLMAKPSSDPLKRQVWKLMGNSESGNGSIEIVPHWKDKDNNINKLILKYIRKPYPIILEDLSPQGLSIEGQTAPKIKTTVDKNRYIFKGTLTTGGEGSAQSYPFILNTAAPIKSGYNLSPENIMDFSIRGFSGLTVELNLTLINPQEGITIKSFNYTLEGVTEELFNEALITNKSVSYEIITYGTVCELAEELHPEILQRAVELAKIFYNGDNQQVITAGTRSE